MNSKPFKALNKRKQENRALLGVHWMSGFYGKELVDSDRRQKTSSQKSETIPNQTLHPAGLSQMKAKTVPHTRTPFDSLQQLFKAKGVFTGVGYVKKSVLVLVLLVNGAH